MHDTDALRRYLKQRREMGESEFILNEASAAEAWRALNAQPDAGAPAKQAAPATSESALIPPVAAVSLEQSGDVPDWRATLRAAGADEVATPKKSSAAAITPAKTATVPRYSLPAPSEDSLISAENKPAISLLPGLEVRTSATDIFTSVSAFNSLDEIVAAVAGCKRCPLHSSALNPVPGEGSATADLVCVGEGPGASEDESGRPFVGAAGKLLTSILGAINLERKDVYICNVVKHRPPGNRNPLPEEIMECQPYLVRQLQIVRPKAILALGTVAAQTLLGTKLTIGKLRGAMHRYDGIPLIVTYHPAALLRNPAWKRPTWEDVQHVRRILDGARGA